jgi:transcriptional regulator with XRE-family HTH domain
MLKEDKSVYLFCDRLRKLRKHLNMNIEDVALHTGLTFSQIQRIESDTRLQDGKYLKRGADGRVATLYLLLDFYGKKVSLDLLFNHNIPVSDLEINKTVEKEIVKEKIKQIIPYLREITELLD